jgi:hypothetical protein
MRGIGPVQSEIAMEPNRSSRMISYSSNICTLRAICESHPPIPDLFSKDPTFLDEIFNDVLLMLIHPTSDGDDHEREWVQTRAHFRA